MTEITIKNAKRCRKFGYGISTTPSGNGTEIRKPRAPRYSGTFNQIETAMRDDHRYLSSIQSAYQSREIFYDGKPIAAVWRMGLIQAAPDCDCHGWGCEHSELAVYDYGWFRLTNYSQLQEGISKTGELLVRVAD